MVPRRNTLFCKNLMQPFSVNYFHSCNKQKQKRYNTHTALPSLWEGPPQTAQTGYYWPADQRGSGSEWNWRQRGRQQVGNRSCDPPAVPGWLPWRRLLAKGWSGLSCASTDCVTMLANFSSMRHGSAFTRTTARTFRRKHIWYVKHLFKEL